MTLSTSTTYYLLRSRNTTVGDGPYVGLAEDGVHTLVPSQSQARRFSTIEEAESYAGGVGKAADEFEVEVRIAD
jgi:hypothetical protein